MTEPSPPRPVPGPPRAVPGPVPPIGGTRPGDGDLLPDGDRPPAAERAAASGPFADLAGRPVAEHVAVFEAEHARLQRELSTIDQV